MESRLNSLEEVEEALSDVPLFDYHTHLIESSLGARGLHDLLLYHFLVAELHSVGCPSGGRLTPYPGYPSEEECEARIKEALPFLPCIQNTSTAWMLRRILSDLYDWNSPITLENWRELDECIRVTGRDTAWHRSILDRLKIHHVCTEYARRGTGKSDLAGRVHYSLEWGFFTRAQAGQYDTPLFELERCWEERPESPLPVCQGERPPTKRRIETLEDLKEALEWYVNAIPFEEVVSMATHLSSEIDYRIPKTAEVRSALKKREKAGLRERDIYAAAIQEEFLRLLEERRPGWVFQFSWGAEPLGHETASRDSSRTLGQIGHMIARHPNLRFVVFSASQVSEQDLCTMCRQLPNLYLAGGWWHNFFPAKIGRLLEERLEMVPARKLLGFFSDAYCVEWTYGKVLLFKKQLARVLWKRIEIGWSSGEGALEDAFEILYDAPLKALLAGPSTNRGI